MKPNEAAAIAILLIAYLIVWVAVKRIIPKWLAKNEKKKPNRIKRYHHINPLLDGKYILDEFRICLPTDIITTECMSYNAPMGN